jgi:transcriptional regulator with XRE-family HTH domain
MKQRPLPSIKVNGAALNYIRKAEGWSLKSLGERAGVSDQFLYQLEHGKRDATRREVFDALVHHLGCDPRALTTTPHELSDQESEAA